MNPVKIFVLTVSLLATSSLSFSQDYTINTMDSSEFQDIGINQADSERIVGYRNIEGMYENYDEVYDSNASEETVEQLRDDVNISVGDTAIYNERAITGSHGYGPAAPDMLDNMLYEML